MDGNGVGLWSERDVVDHRDKSRRPLRGAAAMGEPVLAWLMAPEAPELGTLELLLHRPEWHRRAACRGMAVEVFFPAAGELSDAALQTCGRCPVAGECRDYALASSTAPAGVWGGLHAVQLRQLRLRLRLQRRAG